MVDLSDLDCVICEVVVDYVGQLVGEGEESEDSAVVVKELLLRGNLTAS